jgi:hypothetical protein
MRLFLLILLLSGQILARKTVIDIPFPGGVERVRFDDSTISQADIQRIFKQLDPFLSGFSGYSVPESIEFCVNDDKKYAPCGTRDIKAPNFLHNAEVNIQISAQRLRELEEASFPHELKSVRAYTTALLASGLRVQKCRVEYYMNWNVSTLKTCDATEKTETCDAIVEKLDSITDPMTKYELTSFDWPNCVIRSQHKQLGAYPQNDWNRFLKAYGITEQEIASDD